MPREHRKANIGWFQTFQGDVARVYMTLACEHSLGKKKDVDISCIDSDYIEPRAMYEYVMDIESACAMCLGAYVRLYT
jgi:hypothetical protein